MAQRYARWRRGQCFQGDSRNKTGFVVMGFWAIFYFFFDTKFCDSKDDTILIRSHTRGDSIFYRLPSVCGYG